jgi:hypothetical protein
MRRAPPPAAAYVGRMVVSFMRFASRHPAGLITSAAQRSLGRDPVDALRLIAPGGETPRKFAPCRSFPTSPTACVYFPHVYADDVVVCIDLRRGAVPSGGMPCSSGSILARPVWPGAAGPQIQLDKRHRGGESNVSENVSLGLGCRVQGSGFGV